MLSADPFLRPWLERLLADLGPLHLVDAHTHIGANDPDGFRQSPEQLEARLAEADAVGVAFPMHEPDGYGAANDEVLAAAAASGGRVVAFCRVDPRDGAVAEATRCLDAGARGIKLHPRAERFTLSVPEVRDVVVLAHERRVPVLVHAGRGIPALGRDALRLAGELPDAPLILAHAAVSDLAWLWRELPAHPNLFVDTSWWNASDLLALFALVPPGQLLLGSDSPYGTPVQAAICSLRCALQAGLGAEQARSVAGGQLVRLLEEGEGADLGPAPGRPIRVDPLLARVADYLVGAMNRRIGGLDDSEQIALARLACAVGEDAPQAAVCSSVLALLDRFEKVAAVPAERRHRLSDLHVIACGLIVARTPDVALPDLADEPEPEREAVEA